MTVIIRGIPQYPDVAVRSKPTTVSEQLFRAPVGTAADCDAVQPDSGGATYLGQTYDWLKLRFADGRAGWVRNDLLDLQGDCTPYGYGVYAGRQFAFTAPRTAPASGPAAPVPEPPPTLPNETEHTGLTARVRPDIRAKLRAGTSTATTQLALLDPSTSVEIFGVLTVQGESYPWVRVVANGTEGFIRADLLTYDDATARALNLPLVAAAVAPPVAVPAGSAGGRFKTPVKGPYVVTQEFGHDKHKGTDLGGAVGLPIIADGQGVVAYTMACAKCRADAPNFVSQSVPLWDPVAINDPTWGFGFGNHVVVRYAWADLPATAQAALRGLSFEGVYCYVIHAHLSRIDVQAGATVENGTPLGALGNTGNASGPHLHLEVRLSFDGNEKTIFNRVVVNPRLLYQL